MNINLNGFNLIEASAGSGKTFSITGIFLRLILECQLDVSQILVVTFTEAATAELKERIRSRLIEEGAKQNQPNILLKKAIYSMDESAIFTIHSFCKKLLLENAFESGTIFDLELLPDIEPYINMAIDDYKRINFQNIPAEFLRLIKSTSRNDLFNFNKKALHEKLRNPNAVISPIMEENLNTIIGTKLDYIKCLESDILNAFEELRLAFLQKGHTKDNTSDFLNNNGVVSICEKFHEIKGLKALLSNKDSPISIIYNSMDEKISQYLKISKALKQLINIDLLSFTPKRLNACKTSLNIMSFDDLINNVWEAIEKPQELQTSLINTIRKKFRAVLIDEFQDTDIIQYNIFKSLFFDDENTTSFIIGDPKQSIYGFRGADVFSYNRAKKDSRHKHNLDFNWRSSPALIKAINNLFSRKNPFIYDWISYIPAKYPYGEKPEINNFTINEIKVSPLEIIFIDATSLPPYMLTGKTNNINKPQALEVIADSLCFEIKNLLLSSDNYSVKIGGENIRKSDIAVLVRENSEANFIKVKLLQNGINSVIYSNESVFKSNEADEFIKILRAIEFPSNENLLKTALMTSFIGLELTDIYMMEENTSLFDDWTNRFSGYHNELKKTGFICTINSFITKEKVKTRLITLHDGERRITNLVHIIDLIQKNLYKEKPAISRIVKWLKEEQEKDSAMEEEYLLRLESDENAVKIVTIHKSKGLEFPIVFIPFFYKGSTIKDGGLAKFHNKEGEMLLDLSNPMDEDIKRTAEMEILAENMRLLYVAITRAKSKCCLFWGNVNQSETSAPYYLFHYDGVVDNNIIENLKTHKKNYSNEEMKQDIFDLKNDGIIKVSVYPDNKPKEDYPIKEDTSVELSCKNFPKDREIENNYKISSFSALTRDTHNQERFLDIEYFEPAPENESLDTYETDNSDSIFNFPKGANAGNLFHEILEEINFASKPEEIRTVVTQKLSDYGFENKWANCVTENIYNTLNTPLMQDDCSLILSNISQKDKITELNFYFPVAEMSPNGLLRLFRENKNNTPEKFTKMVADLNFPYFKGFIKGFMDLVFRYNGKYYLLDWKSNHLGGKIEDYHKEKLIEAISGNFYFIQYYLYNIALDHYLKLRIKDYDYNKDFGGVFYIFLRGMNREFGSYFGVYYDKIDFELLGSLQKGIMGV